MEYNYICLYTTGRYTNSLISALFFPLQWNAADVPEVYKLCMHPPPKIKTI